MFLGRHPLLSAGPKLSHLFLLLNIQRLVASPKRLAEWRWVAGQDSDGEADKLQDGEFGVLKTAHCPGDDMEMDQTLAWKGGKEMKQRTPYSAAGDLHAR
jgi:hypothetical protein